jgi:hypothetical protein
VITLRNNRLTVCLDERRGAEITQIAIGSVELLAYYDWDSPVSMSRSTSYGKHRHDWLSEYRGGWQFLVPNAGPECEVDGVNLPFHGEWSRTSVDVIAQSDTMVRVRAGTRLPITVTREISLRDNPDRVEIVTQVHNSSSESTSYIWGEHPAFQALAGAEIDLPTANVVGALAPRRFGLSQCHQRQRAARERAFHHRPDRWLGRPSTLGYRSCDGVGCPRFSARVAVA